MDVVVLAALGARRLHGEIDLFSTQGEAPATTVAADLHLKIPRHVGAADAAYCTRVPGAKPATMHDVR
jgi:hypothetical protein